MVEISMFPVFFRKTDVREKILYIKYAHRVNISVNIDFWAGLKAKSNRPVKKDKRSAYLEVKKHNSSIKFS